MKLRKIVTMGMATLIAVSAMSLSAFAFLQQCTSTNI